MRFILTGGQDSDDTQILPLLDALHAGAILADKGYDADSVIEAVKHIGAQAVIPPQSNRKTPRDYDTALCKERNVQ